LRGPKGGSDQDDHSRDEPRNQIQSRQHTAVDEVEYRFPPIMTDRRSGFVPIEDYAVLGDGRTVALVASDGRVDWWPIPTIDAPTLCAAILDPDNGGYFALAPVGAFRVSRRYLPGTNVLEAAYSTASGSCRVVESLNTGLGGRLPWTELARRVTGLTGHVDMAWELRPGDRFGHAHPRIAVRGATPVLTLEDQTVGIIVSGNTQPTINGCWVSGMFSIGAGESHLVAAVATDNEPLFLPASAEIDTRIDRTIQSWVEWTTAMNYQGPWADQVVRSALSLKTLLYEPGGAIAAAATTSLPERVGGDKNWDYRYSWVRDSSFTVDAFLNLNLNEEVHASISWLLSALRRSDSKLRVFYSLGGDVADGQTELDVPGYRASTPVRAGNSASTQIQLGTYGDFFDTMFRYVEDGHLLDDDTARLLSDLADQCCDSWMEKDSGIWELPQLEHYTISKIGCWTALDRAVRLAEVNQLPVNRADRWKSEVKQIERWIHKHCWSDAQQSYTLHSGGEKLDAAVLLAGRTGFDRGPRLASTTKAIQKALAVDHSPLLYRYTGMEQEEGTFVACTFWMVEALVYIGDLVQATSLMEEAVALTSELGLLAEQIDPADGSFLGNYPQALSHLSLINAAHAISRGTESS
jgi:GH15 family glucan-1,4-alpha-glucosidase